MTLISDVGSERAVLSGIAQYGRDGLIEVDDIVTVDTFTDSSNQMVYKVFKHILATCEVLDVPSIVSGSQEVNLYDAVAKQKKDLEYIRALFSLPIKKDSIRQFAKKIAKFAFARKAQAAHKEAHDNLSLLKGNETLDEIITISEKPIFDLVIESNKGKDDAPVLLFENIMEVIQDIMDNPCENVGVPTPWKYYNASIGGGFRRGGVNIIGARIKKGKTTIAKEIGLHVTTKLNYKLLFLDTEMGGIDQQLRSLSSMSKVAIGKIERGSFADSLLEKQAVLEMAKMCQDNKNFYYKSIAGKPFDEVMSIIRRWIVKEVGFNDDGTTKDCLVLYDYFKLMNKGDLGSLKEYEALGYQISTFTDFCKQFDFPVCAFVQLNRQEDISQSDRLRWLCHSYSAFLDKKPDQLLNDGPENGNRAMTVLDARYGPGTPETYINMRLIGDIATIHEIGLNGSQQDNNSSGGSIQSANTNTPSKDTGFIVNEDENKSEKLFDDEPPEELQS